MFDPELKSCVTALELVPIICGASARALLPFANNTIWMSLSAQWGIRQAVPGVVHGTWGHFGVQPNVLRSPIRSSRDFDTPYSLLSKTCSLRFETVSHSFSSRTSSYTSFGFASLFFCVRKSRSHAPPTLHSFHTPRHTPLRHNLIHTAKYLPTQQLHLNDFGAGLSVG